MAGMPVSASWHDTQTLEDNLKVFETMVWRDYLKPQCVQLADHLRCNQNSWDRFDAAKSIWEHVGNYPYIAPPVGEELYQSFDSFMSRPGGDCDNKTLVACCLMLAAGVPCRAVVIELPNAEGGPSGEGHMYPEAKIPGMGWVTFDPSRRMPPPTFDGHAVKGWTRATVDFTGKRPDGAAKNMITGHSMMSAGMLTGAGGWGSIEEAEAWCGTQPQPGSSMSKDWLACYDKGASGWGFESDDATPSGGGGGGGGGGWGWLGDIGDALVGGTVRTIGRLTGAPPARVAAQEEGMPGWVAPVAIVGAIIGGFALYKSVKKRG